MNEKIGIQDIGTVLGSVATDNIKKYPGKVGEDYLRGTVGILHTFHKRPEESAIDLCAQAFADLQKTCPVSATEIDLVVVVSQHTRPNIPPLSALLSGRLSFKESTYCLDLSIGCTGFVQGAHVLTSLMRGRDWKRALLFNVETLSEVLAPDEVNTNFIFSDAATATLFCQKDVLASFVDFDFATSGDLCLALNAVNAQLSMDGLTIYNYVVRHVPKRLQTLLEAHRLTPSDLNSIFFHQASLRTVNKVKEFFSAAVPRIPYDILEYGNTGSCTIPFLLKKYLNEMTAEDKKHFVLSSFGSGLSYANALLKMS